MPATVHNSEAHNTVSYASCRSDWLVFVFPDVIVSVEVLFLEQKGFECHETYDRNNTNTGVAGCFVNVVVAGGVGTVLVRQQHQIPPVATTLTRHPSSNTVTKRQQHTTTSSLKH